MARNERERERNINTSQSVIHDIDRRRKDYLINIIALNVGHHRHKHPDGKCEVEHFCLGAELNQIPQRFFTLLFSSSTASEGTHVDSLATTISDRGSAFNLVPLSVRKMKYMLKKMTRHPMNACMCNTAVH